MQYDSIDKVVSIGWPKGASKRFPPPVLFVRNRQNEIFLGRPLLVALCWYELSPVIDVVVVGCGVNADTDSSNCRGIGYIEMCPSGYFSLDHGRFKMCKF